MKLLGMKDLKLKNEYESKLSQLTAKYESQINSLKETHKKEIDSQKIQIEAKFKYDISQIELKHSEQTNSLKAEITSNKKIDEDFDIVVVCESTPYVVYDDKEPVNNSSYKG